MGDHVIVAILLLVFFTSAFMERPAKSPLIWFVIGLLITAAHSIEAWNWLQSPLLENSNDLAESVHEQVEESVMNEFWHSILFAGVGMLISIASIVKLVKKKSA